MPHKYECDECHDNELDDEVEEVYFIGNKIYCERCYERLSGYPGDEPRT